MKNIAIFTDKHSSCMSELPIINTAACIGSIHEKWHIAIDCNDKEGNELELAKFEIMLPNTDNSSKFFIGTIQDLQSIPVILKNAFNTLTLLYPSQKDEDQTEIGATLTELAHALSLFK